MVARGSVLSDEGATFRNSCATPTCYRFGVGGTASCEAAGRSTTGGGPANTSADECGKNEHGGAETLKLNFESTHNSHLLTAGAGFLASASLAKQLPALLSPTGKVFLQTNTEDVAVAMRHLFEADERLCMVEDAACGYSPEGFAAATHPTPATVAGTNTAVGVGAGGSDDAASAREINNAVAGASSVETDGAGNADAGAGGTSAPRRSLRSASWLARGGVSADGAGWLSGNPWGDSCQARTETEVWCEAERFRVYRCALTLRN